MAIIQNLLVGEEKTFLAKRFPHFAGATPFDEDQQHQGSTPFNHQAQQREATRLVRQNCNILCH